MTSETTSHLSERSSESEEQQRSKGFGRPPVPCLWETTTRPFWFEGLSEEQKRFASEDHRLSRKFGGCPAQEAEEQLEEKYDVVVVGAGLTGLSVAHWLSKVAPELTVGIVEARALCGGATGRNGGHLWASVEVPEPEQLEDWTLEQYQVAGRWLLESAQLFRDFVRDELFADEDLKKTEENDPQLTMTGGLDVAIYEEELEDSRKYIDEIREVDLAHGDHSLWDKRAQPSSVLPQERLASLPSTPTHLISLLRTCHGGLYQSSLVGQFWPAKVVQAMARKLLNRHKLHGLHTHARVVDHSPDASSSLIPINSGSSSIHHTQLLVVPEEDYFANQSQSSSSNPPPRRPRTLRIVASHVVHATNAYSSFLLPSLDGVIVPVRGQAIITAPLLAPSSDSASRERIPLPMPVSLSINDGLEYAIQRVRDGRVVLGGMRWKSSTNTKEIWNHDDSTIDPFVSDGLREMLQEHFRVTDLSATGSSFDGEPKVEHEWTGIMGFSCDHHPLIGRLPVQLLPTQFSSSPSVAHWIAAGYSGNGMTQCFGAGKAIAEMIAGLRHPSKDWVPSLNPERFADPTYMKKHQGYTEFE